MIERPQGKIAADRIFAQFAINAGQSNIDVAAQVAQVVFFSLFERFFEERDSLRLVREIVIRDRELGRDANLRLGL